MSEVQTDPARVRVLDFVVNRQIISKSPTGDFKGIVSGTKGYFKARFTFSPEWSGLKKVVIFRSKSTTKYVPLPGNECMIPDDVLTGMTYYVSVVGKSATLVLRTNETFVSQQRGGR